MINLYKYLGIILIPFIKINLFLRILKGKENKERFSERYGIASIKRPKGNLVWIHAASIGEFKSTDLLILNWLIILSRFIKYIFSFLCFSK